MMKGDDNSKYTTTSLIKELEKFPKDLPIETDLAFAYDDDFYSEGEYDSEEDLYDAFKAHAIRLAIFEGSWEEDNISDLNNILPEFIPGWDVDDHCGSNAILKKDIISCLFNLYSYDDILSGGTREFVELLGLAEEISEIDCKVNAQEKYAKENNLPLFAPRDGLCICGKQIYNEISLEKAGSELITYCPYCSFAYDD